ncbi:histidine kinase [Runella rosea]|uniref:Histidine kinase n=1 Tax=Runella rosea TaxID=2259595 RepID=A0A344TEC6_9BACT|nr:histidine kinase [Runella rosea]AXE16997.1 histidine kinase [Runella rosea]
MDSPDDRKLLLLGPLALWTISTIFFNLNMFNGVVPSFKFLIFGLLSVYFTWILVRFLVFRVRRRFQGIPNTRKRILTLIALMFPGTVVAVGCRVIALKYWVYKDTALTDADIDVLFMTGLSFFNFTIIYSLYESHYFFQQWNIVNRQKEELARANLEMQLDSLKNQVKPHFLFNSLNALQALVKTQQTQTAMKFITDLSQVYRYLLQSNEQTLISLQKELDFMHAYFSLLKTRFSKGLHLEVKVNPQWHNYQLPPMTLQLLVENAVKHNKVSSQNPLTIKIESVEEAYIQVSNNLQRKNNDSLPTTKKGLVSISAKYELLQLPPIDLYEDTENYIVRIPLIKPQE